MDKKNKTFGYDDIEGAINGAQEKESTTEVKETDGADVVPDEKEKVQDLTTAPDKQSDTTLSFYRNPDNNEVRVVKDVDGQLKVVVKIGVGDEAATALITDKDQATTGLDSMEDFVPSEEELAVLSAKTEDAIRDLKGKL